MQKTEILLVEDEANFAVVMRDYLQINGYSVTLCNDGLIGLSKFQQGNYDLCIIDVMMPKMDGFALVEEIRKTNVQVPVLFLTARSMREDMLKGYRVGADDYIIKPFDTELLLLKIEAVLKRSGNKITDAIHGEVSFSGFTYNHSHRVLYHSSGTENKLSPKESDLLSLLLQNKNRVVSKSVLLQKIWKNENYFTGRSMDVYIAKLRKYLETDGLVGIENIHGSGYCLKCRN
jgi:two-component system, OmpR family, response regulator